MKLVDRQRRVDPDVASPGRKAGCGLKLVRGRRGDVPDRRITRPKGRVRIETTYCRALSSTSTQASPGRKAGCGLKQVRPLRQRADQPGITRPKGRVRIETARGSGGRAGNAGITRPKGRVRIETVHHAQKAQGLAASPGRKAGCGLKLDAARTTARTNRHHPAERPGAD